MYLLMKVHKHMIAKRETINTKNKVLGPDSIWVDYHLQKTKHLIPTYLQDSNKILNRLERCPPFPRGAKLFTNDLVAMYLNINTNEGLANVSDVFKANRKELPIDFPTDAILDFMGLVLGNNVFHFEDTYCI